MREKNISYGTRFAVSYQYVFKDAVLEAEWVVLGALVPVRRPQRVDAHARKDDWVLVLLDA